MRQMTWMRGDRQTDAEDGNEPTDARDMRPRRRTPLIQISNFSPRPGSLLDDLDPMMPPAIDPEPEEREREQPALAGPLPEAEPDTHGLQQAPPNATPAFAAESLQPVPALIDTRGLLGAVWRHRRVVLALALAGALLGAVAGPLVPRKYSAVTSLYFDPRQIELTQEPAAPTGFSRDAFQAVIDSQIRILTSTRVLEKTALALGLDKDAAFAGRSGGMALQGAVEALQKALKVEREDNTYIVNLTVTGRQAERSAEIANQIVTSFLQEEDSASSAFYGDANTTLDGRLDVLAKRLQEAERAVETYKAEHGMVSADGGLIADKRLLALDEMLLAAQKAAIDAAARAEAASRLRFEDLVGQGVPTSVSSPSLVDLRRQYSVQAANVKSLESQLGARHPRLAAARASLNGIAGEIRRELQRYVAATRTELAEARKTETDLGREMAAQKTAQSDTSIRQVELNELTRRAVAARNIYETMLKRTQQTGEEQSLSKSNIRIVAKAETPLKADGPGRGALMAATVIGGLIAGLGAGILYAVFRLLAGHPYFRSLAEDMRQQAPAANAAAGVDRARQTPSIRKKGGKREFWRRWLKRR